MKVFKLVLLLVCALCILEGCKEKGDVIAKVGNDTITTEDFSERLMSAPQKTIC